MDVYSFIMLGGGLGLFLYGMKFMSEGLEQAAGSKLRNLFEILTSRRLFGVAVGTLFTAVIQSSSATTVMVVGFVNAGLMNLSQASGVIMGANIGTTITGVLVALNLTQIAPLFVLVGVILSMFFRKRLSQHIGQIIFGFGILFIGLGMMASSIAPLKTDPSFQNILIAFENPLLGILAGMVVTSIIQSSSASIGILQALALSGVMVSLEQGIFAVLGMNIGTCVTALLACIGTNSTAKRAAVFHLILNIFGAVFFTIVLLFTPFIEWMRMLSPGSVAQQIAVSNIIFKTVEVGLAFPFTNYILKLACRIVPSREIAFEEMKPHFIDQRLLTTPPIAVAQVFKEVQRMGDLALSNFRAATRALFERDEKAVREVIEHERVIDYLEHTITKFLVDISALELSASDAKMIGTFYHVVNDMERVGDHCENLIEYKQSMDEHHVQFSQAAWDELRLMSEKVTYQLEQTLEIFKTRDMSRAGEIAPREREIDDMEKEYRYRHIERLNAQQCSGRAGMLFGDILSNFERVADHATNIGYSVLDVEIDQSDL